MLFWWWVSFVVVSVVFFFVCFIFVFGSFFMWLVGCCVELGLDEGIKFIFRLEIL